MAIQFGTTKENASAYLDSKALTTHTAVLGMTGSGKSGAVLGLAEELVGARVPIIIVDIKGDMINFALREQHPNVVVRCVTPGGTHGEPVNLFSQLADPDKVIQATSTVLSLVGEDPNPLTSRAHAYVSTVLFNIHTVSMGASLHDLIGSVQNPGFDRLGALDLDVAFPTRARNNLAGKLNNLLITPSFKAWRQGVTLDLDKFMNDPFGRTPVLIYSVAHLPSQKEQQFALSILFDEVLRWTKSLPGTDKLKACMIVDECVGLLPPYPNNPPTKTALLLLLKQARAFGVGLILATQNPVDLDYKAMSNCGTWLIGRLAMERDKKRVIDGVCANTAVTQTTMEACIGGLQPREFVMVRPKGVLTIRSKDVSCELRGPMSLADVNMLYHTKQLQYEVPEEAMQLQLKAAKQEMDYTEIATLERKLGVFGRVKQWLGVT